MKRYAIVGNWIQYYYDTEVLSLALVFHHFTCKILIESYRVENAQ